MALLPKNHWSEPAKPIAVQDVAASGGIEHDTVDVRGQVGQRRVGRFPVTESAPERLYLQGGEHSRDVAR